MRRRVILLLHNRYRVPGGEERAVADLAWLIRTELGEEVEVLERDSAALGRRDAARGLLTGGLGAAEVAEAVRRTGARVVHAHNLQPTLGWRALAAARAEGARVVCHLHNYRLVCAVGTCFTRGEDCTRCHGRWTWPGVRLNCRGGSRAESAAYGAGLALWQPKMTADAFVVPSAFALARLDSARRPARRPRAGDPVGAADVRRALGGRRGEYALFAGRLTAEKGVADAIAACRAAGRARLSSPATGRTPLRCVRPPRMSASRAGSTPASSPRCARAPALALVPSRYAEILPLAALEAMAAGLPVVASRAGGLAEIVPEAGLHPPGDVAAMTARIRALFRSAAAGDEALAVARERTAPPVVAAALREVYDR